MILLEVVKQLLEFDFIQKEKHKTRITFPIAIGKTLEVCHIVAAASTVIDEIAFYRLGTYKSKDKFDPHKSVERIKGERFKHKVDIEDY